jgi:SNF2 family DNA or RNA helicase
MAPAWAEDLKKFAPELTYTLAYAEKREEAFLTNTNIIIMNHDGVTWLQKAIKDRKLPLLNNFCQLIVDESTAFKNHSQRSTAIIFLKQFFKYRMLLTGTPYTNSLTDIWRQTLIADDGERMGNSFFKFRATICEGRQLGNGVTVWQDKPGMEPIVYHLIRDICIRHKLEDCIEIPPNTIYEVAYDLNKKHAAIYRTMEDDALLELKAGEITALNAAILANKLLQIASGAVYDTFGQYHLIDTDRYELIRDLAEARPQCIIAFHWRHQKDQLLKLLPQAKVIDGSVSINDRNQCVAEFQAGHIPHLLIHPQSGAHGLTLTAGHATIWASPTYSSEQFVQFNRRIYRAGQVKKTETILITAKNTLENSVYAKLQGKLDKMHNILSLLEQR